MGFCEFSGAVFVRNPLNRELVATFEITVSVHDNASEVIDMSGSVPNGKLFLHHEPCLQFHAFCFHHLPLFSMWPSL